MDRLSARLKRWSLVLALLPMATMVGCLGVDAVAVQKALSSGLQAAANGVIGIAIRVLANSLVGLPPNPV